MQLRFNCFALLCFALLCVGLFSVALLGMSPMSGYPKVVFAVRSGLIAMVFKTASTNARFGSTLHNPALKPCFGLRPERFRIELGNTPKGELGTV